MNDELRKALVSFIKSKFRSYSNVYLLADDIVHEVYLTLLKSNNYSSDKENWGYLSISCLRMAYRQFMAQSVKQNELTLDLPDTVLINENDFVNEIIQADDTQIILNSLNTLKAIERIIVTQRYYGDYTFSEIASTNNLNLNTVLSHHRRALTKLRPQLTKLLGYRKDQRYE